MQGDSDLFWGGGVGSWHDPLVAPGGGRLCFGTESLTYLTPKLTPSIGWIEIRFGIVPLTSDLISILSGCGDYNPTIFASILLQLVPSRTPRRGAGNANWVIPMTNPKNDDASVSVV